MTKNGNAEHSIKQIDKILNLLSKVDDERAALEIYTGWDIDINTELYRIEDIERELCKIRVDALQNLYI